MEVGRLVSDRERELTVERLRTAHVEGYLDLDEFGERVGRAYASRTRGDLDTVTADLPAVPAPAPHTVPLRPVGRVVGVLSGARRQGRWRPERHLRVVAVLGSAVVDLTEADLDELATPGGPPAALTITAVAVFGGIEVLVPEGMPVELDGVAVLGGRECRVRSVPPVAGAPVVTVRARVVLGGVTVRSHRFRRGLPGHGDR